MKNKLLKFLALAFTCATLSAVATACGNGTLGNNSSSSSENSVESSVEDSSSSIDSSVESSIEDSSSEDSSSTLEEKGLTFKTLSVDGDTAYGKFSNAIEEFSFANEIALSGDTTFEVAKDKYGSQTYLLQEVPLNEGDNVFYVFEMNGKTVVNRYTVTLRRRRIYNVTFNTQDGTEITSQEIEEDGFATMPEQPTRKGYTFKDWNFDFTKPITKNVTVKPNWTVNQYTLTIVYDNGQPDKKITQDYNTAIENVTPPEKGGYTFIGWDKTIPSVMPAEDVTVTARWQFFLMHNGGTVTGLTGLGETLSEIEIPSQIDGVTITSIGDWAFSNCSSLTSIEIPNSVTSIGKGAFDGCDNLQYTIKENLKYLGNATNPYLYLAGTTSTSITSANIDDNCRFIGEYAFSNCSSLTSVEIPNSVTSIGEYAFLGCESLTGIEIPDSVTSIGHGAFYACDSLISIVITDSVTSIGNYAFYDCSGLTSVEIPNSVTSIGDSAFSKCRSLTSIEVGKNNPYYQSIDGNLYSKDGKTLIQYAIGKTATSFIIPAGVTSIGDNAFYYCESLTSVVIPDSVTSIGDYAFYNCSSLTSIEIPDSVTSIGEYAFYNCRSLTSIEIPNGVTSIGYGAFRKCDNLQYTIKDNLKYLGNTTNPYLCLVGTISTSITSANIDDNCKIIGDYAFEYCSSLTSIEVGKNNPYYQSIDGNLYSKDGKTLIQYAIGKTANSFIIPAGVTSIGGGAFLYCDSLTSIEIPDSVTSIGDWAFGYCSSLTSIEIPDGVTSIGEYAFYDCSGLTSIEIPDSVTSIGQSAFAMCKNLVNVKLSNVIGVGAFHDSGLTSVVIPDSVNIVDDSAFSNCDRLTSVVIGSGVKSIEGGAFCLCDSLTDVYYAGTASEWEALAENIGSCNVELLEATRYYYVENEADVPQDGGRYWRYVDGVPTAW